MVLKLKKYTDDPGFTVEGVAKQSNAAKSLCLWVYAMDKYCAVAKVVAPKKMALKEAEKALEAAKKELEECKKAIEAAQQEEVEDNKHRDIVQQAKSQLKTRTLLTNTVSIHIRWLQQHLLTSNLR